MKFCFSINMLRRVFVGIGATIITFIFFACSDDHLQAIQPDSEKKKNIAESMTCIKTGPLACNVPPISSLIKDGCAQLRSCIEGREIGGETILGIEACDEPVVAPSGYDFGRLAVMAADLVIDGPPSHGAFLFAHTADGWCAIDQLLASTWKHGGYCRVSIHFEQGGSADVITTITSERICHTPLDQSEIAAEESDIATIECTHVRYRNSAGGNEKLSETRIDGACEDK
ncbi:hypothetical protein C8R34_1446 [Nitrosomonas sp. Nm84]|nr:hypothetical protein C8R34_1446 [Nitrosomonas sp. Nm84]